MPRTTRIALVGVVSALMFALPQAQRTDSRLSAFIDAIRAVDNHSHVVAPDLERDHDYDALPCDALPAGSALPPLNMRFGPRTLAAWKALYGLAGTGAEDVQIKAARSAQDAVRRREGDRYFTGVLDKAGIETVLANRVRMAPELSGPRFRWVPYDDALLFPLDNSVEKNRTADRNVFYAREEQLLRQDPEGRTSQPAPVNAGPLPRVRRLDAAAAEERRRGRHQVRSGVPAVARLRAGGPRGR